MELLGSEWQWSKTGGDKKDWDKCTELLVIDLVLAWHWGLVSFQLSQGSQIYQKIYTECPINVTLDKQKIN